MEQNAIKAKDYADSIFEGFRLDGVPSSSKSIRGMIIAAFVAGFKEAHTLQWKDPAVEIPEDDRQVLVETDCKDKELRYAISYFLAGAWHFPDDWYYDCRVVKWMYIPSEKGGEK
ncbi:hypothetical protein [Duncaniella muris]|uniref:hypothetical protein n=2 Tax=Muribaculaceae TaxID=2005473 RepID=UPI00263AAE73|nr:hypothetical protein [Duncaniella muris]